MIDSKASSSDQVSTGGLLVFYGLEQGPKVSGSETLVVSSLNDLVEDSRFILGGLGEDLKKVSLVIVVNEDLLLL